MRVLLTRNPGGELALDTTLTLPAGTDSVDLSLSVVLNQPDETFSLTLALITSSGDTAFRAGPVDVTPATSGAPPSVEMTLTYTGIGADAWGVAITSPDTTAFAGDTLVLQAMAMDSSQAPIANTPIAWRSLDSTMLRVTSRAQGRVVGLGRGTTLVVAELLTGQADTMELGFLLPPATLVADSGSGQTGPATNALPEPLVALVSASDGLPVAGVWVRFTVASGGGSVDADSVLTDEDGRARTIWTLGNLAGTQTVHATTARLPGVTGTFTATSQATGPAEIQIIEGNEQTALVGTEVAVAPRVRVLDWDGNPVPDLSVAFAVTQGAGNVTGATPLTDADGYAAVQGWTLGSTVGINHLTVTVSGLTPVQFVALATGPGGATTMTIAAGNGQTTLAGTAVPLPPAVLVTDTAGMPVVGVTVTFSVISGGGTVEEAEPATDEAGVATVGAWILGSPGTNTLQASLAGLTPVDFSATGTVGPADTIVAVSGSGQSAEAGTMLAEPLVVEVRDEAGNAVASVEVVWATLYGSVTLSSGLTNAQGRAEATWTLGTNAIGQTATASVQGLTPAVFNATALFPNPSVLLALEGANRIRLTDSVVMNVTLTAPPPEGGVLVNLSVDNELVVGLGVSELSITEGDTAGSLWLYGLSAGSTTVRATAEGYADGALPVLVTVQVLSAPLTLNVPYGGSASLPLQISTPAPPGGVTVSLVSDNPLAVAVQTPSVTILEGQQAVNAFLSGVDLGSATITASTVDFGIAQTVATSRANLNIVQSSLTISETLSDSVRIRLESGGVQVAAPAGGIMVNMTSRNTDCAVAVSPVTIPAGLVSTTSLISYGGESTTPCNTWVVAEAGAIDPDSVYITVNPPPGFTTYSWTTGAGLQRGAYAYLGIANHGGVNVVIKSADPSMLLIAPNAGTVGSDSIVRFVANGQNYFDFWLQAVEGVADTGVVSLQVTYQATGFADGSSAATIRPPVFDLLGIPASTTTLSAQSAVYAYIGYTLPGYTYVVEEQQVRRGGEPLTLTLTNSQTGVGELVTTDLSGDEVTVTIPVGASRSPTSVAAGGAAFQPLASGSTTITGTIPGYTQMTYYNKNITVSAPGFTTYAWTTGAGLQRSAYGYLGASNHGGVNVVIRSPDPSMLLIAPNTGTVGSDSLVRFVADGQTYFDFVLQAVEGVADTGVVTLELTYEAPGFNTGTSAATIRPPVFDLLGIPANTTTLSGQSAVYAYIGYTLPGYTYVIEEQQVRRGGEPLTLTLTNSQTGVGELVTTDLSGDEVTVTIPVGASRSPTSVAAGGAAFQPLASGSTTITGTIPGYTQMTYYNKNITVSAPGFTTYAWTTGAGLQRSAYGYLGASNHGGVNVVIRSPDPSMLLIAPNTGTVGSDSLVRFVADGQTYFDFVLQAVEGVADTGVVTLELTYEAPGFNTGTSAATIRPPVFDLLGIPATTTTFSNPSAVYGYLGYTLPGYTYVVEEQQVRRGGEALTLTLTHSTPGVGRLVTTDFTGDEVTVTIPVGASRSPTSVATGGAAFEPLTSGTTTITGSIPGFTQMTYYNKTVTVSTPTITMYEWTVGSGLQKSVYGFLGAVNHGGTSVVIKSSAPSVAVVSPDANTAGTDSIVVFVANGNQYFYYHVQGVEGQTGTVTVTARANGFTDGSAPLNVVQSAVGLYNVPSSMSLSSGADSVAFYAQVGVPQSNLQYLSEVQNVRAGSGPLTVTVTSGAPAVAELVTLSERGGTVTVQIPVGLYYSPTTVAGGGVAIRKLSEGTTVVSGAVSGFVTLSVEGNRSVQVNP